MKKRLRKKKNLREFREWGIPIAITIKSDSDFDGFFEDFIEQAIENNDCFFGGGGSIDHLEGFIELGRSSDHPEERLKRIVTWLDCHDVVEKYVAGKLVDAWYGPFDELDSIGKKI